MLHQSSSRSFENYATQHMSNCLTKSYFTTTIILLCYLIPHLRPHLSRTTFTEDRIASYFLNTLTISWTQTLFLVYCTKIDNDYTKRSYTFATKLIQWLSDPTLLRRAFFLSHSFYIHLHVVIFCISLRSVKLFLINKYCTKIKKISHSQTFI